MEFICGFNYKKQDLSHKCSNITGDRTRIKKNVKVLFTALSDG